MAAPSRTSTPELVPKAVRIAFRNLCSSIYLGAINDMFEMDGFAPDLQADPDVVGQRRTLVEQYHAAIDWRDPGTARRLLRVYSRVLREHGRGADGGWWRDARRLVLELDANGFNVAADGTITPPRDFDAAALELTDYHRLSDPDVVGQYLIRMDSAVSSDPDEAIGYAKELVESVCKFVLEDANLDPSAHRDLPSLYKATAKELKIATDSVPDSAKGSTAAHQVLRSLSSAVQGMAELRNELGSGHGKTRKSPATARHARLAAGAARTLTVFLLDTWHTRAGSRLVPPHLRETDRRLNLRDPETSP
jgi:hypothetical protein